MSNNTLERSNNNVIPGRSTSLHRKCCDVHCNSLWSVWYGLFIVIFEAFIVYKCVCRFLLYVALPWPDRKQPYLELNLYVGLVGAGVVLLPFYFISFMFKIGNLANDGYKLGYGLSACAMDPPSILSTTSGIIKNAWHHGGPTAPFIHLVSAFCFLLPKIFIEAKLLQVGFLSKGNFLLFIFSGSAKMRHSLPYLIVLKGQFTPGKKSVRYLWDMERNNLLLKHFGKMSVNYRDISEFDLTKMLKM